MVHWTASPAHSRDPTAFRPGWWASPLNSGALRPRCLAQLTLCTTRTGGPPGILENSLPGQVPLPKTWPLLLANKRRLRVSSLDHLSGGAARQEAYTAQEQLCPARSGGAWTAGAQNRYVTLEANSDQSADS